MNSDSTLFTDICLKCVSLSRDYYFGCRCIAVAKRIHSNHCIGDLCYIRIELNDSDSTLFTDIVISVLV